MNSGLRWLLAVLSIILLDGGLLLAQYDVEVLQSLQTFGYASLDYRERQLEIKDVKGTPYLTDEFMEGRVLMGHTVYEGIQLRYNIYSDRFEARLGEQTIELDPVKNAIDTLYYADNKFVRRFLQPDKNRMLSHVAVIYSDVDCTLFKHYRINFNPAKQPGAYENPKPAEFTPARPVYYLGGGEGLSLVNGAKSIAAFFMVDTKQVKSFVNSNQLKLSNEDHLARVCAYFSKHPSR
jgi:hypothetical protein